MLRPDRPLAQGRLEHSPHGLPTRSDCFVVPSRCVRQREWSIQSRQSGHRMFPREMVVPLQPDRRVRNDVADLAGRSSRIRKVTVSAIHQFVEQPNLSHDLMVQFTRNVDCGVEDCVRVLFAQRRHEACIADERGGFLVCSNSHRPSLRSGDGEVLQQRPMQGWPQAQACDEPVVGHCVSVPPSTMNVGGKALHHSRRMAGGQQHEKTRCGATARRTRMMLSRDPPLLAFKCSDRLTKSLFQLGIGSSIDQSVRDGGVYAEYRSGELLQRPTMSFRSLVSLVPVVFVRWRRSCLEHGLGIRHAPSPCLQSCSVGQTDFRGRRRLRLTFRDYQG